MARTESTMLELGTPAPAFDLPEPLSGRQVGLADYAGKPLLVAFSCNHGPSVQHILDGLVDFVREYQARGLHVVAISANDVASHPDDGPGPMAELARRKDLPMAYLYDESQAVAQAYKAACTPDFFLFDADHRLVYRGQFDGSRPNSGTPVTGADLRAAADAVLAGQAVPAEQRPSMGCNIKWKAGREPDYYAA